MKKQVLWEGSVGNAYYSTAIVAGDYIFISGQGPIDPKTDKIIGTTIEEQTRYTLNNLFSILEAAGASRDNIVKINAYLHDIADFDRYTEAYKELMPEIKPARTTVGAKLVDIMIEIDCIAYIGKS